MPELKKVKCVVCGTGSHRADWQDGKPHACDSHSEKEVADAVAKLNAPSVKGPISITAPEPELVGKPEPKVPTPIK